MEIKHTPTPWHTDKKSNHIYSGTKMVAMTCGTEPPIFTDATFIVRCVNSHEKLVAVLKQARGIVQMVDDAECGQIDLLSAIDAAIKEAEGK